MRVNDPLHIVQFTAEAVPYVKVGGLGDIIESLSKALSRLGTRITILVPAYKSIDHKEHRIHRADESLNFSFELGHEPVAVEVFQARQAAPKIDVFFLKCGDYFERGGIYDDPVTKEGYPDNMKRFIAFMRAGLELLPRLKAPVDIVHCHDAQTGLVPGLLRTNLQNNPFFRRIGTLFTIHNLAYQEIHRMEALYWADVDYRHFFPMSPFEYWGSVNFMKVGIECADVVNTVSETYAREIRSSSEFGYGLEGVLRNRQNELVGILNGIDEEEWNPETDRFLPARYSARDLSGKAACKREVLRRAGLPDSDLPLIGIVSRLVEQKGFDLIHAASQEIARMGIQMVVLGTGQKRYHEMFEALARQHPHKVAIKLAFDNEFSHQIIAGADMSLMPSKYEPCGLNQLYSHRYGTIPIVRATGGLADTVIDFDGDRRGSTGFAFTEYTPKALVSALGRAVAVYSNPARWREIMLQAMAQDWSWNRSAHRYLEIYRNISRVMHSRLHDAK